MFSHVCVLMMMYSGETYWYQPEETNIPHYIEPGTLTHTRNFVYIRNFVRRKMRISSRIHKVIWEKSIKNEIWNASAGFLNFLQKYGRYFWWIGHSKVIKKVFRSWHRFHGMLVVSRSTMKSVSRMGLRLVTFLSSHQWAVYDDHITVDIRGSSHQRIVLRVCNESLSPYLKSSACISGIQTTFSKYSSSSSITVLLAVQPLSCGYSWLRETNLLQMELGWIL